MISMFILVLYLVIGGVLASANLGATTWQYWAIVVCVGAIDILSYVKGLKND